MKTFSLECPHRQFRNKTLFLQVKPQQKTRCRIQELAALTTNNATSIFGILWLFVNKPRNNTKFELLLLHLWVAFAVKFMD